jgi:hypothetical protein
MAARLKKRRLGSGPAPPELAYRPIRHEGETAEGRLRDKTLPPPHTTCRLAAEGRPLADSRRPISRWADSRTSLASRAAPGPKSAGGLDDARHRRRF